MSAQLEDGYTRIANEIAEAMAKLKISNYESRLLWCLFRKTYGYHKKEDFISLTQFEKMTGIASRHIARAKSSLLARNIIYLKGKKIGFVKDVPSWVLPNQGVPNKGLGSPSLGNKTFPIQGDTKEKKETNKRKEKQMSADSFFNSLKEESSEQTVAKAKEFDLRPKDITYSAKLANSWCNGKELENNTEKYWVEFFNQWLLRGIRRHELATLSDKAEKQAEENKPKLSAEDKWIIENVKII